MMLTKKHWIGFLLLAMSPLTVHAHEFVVSGPEVIGLAQVDVASAELAPSGSLPEASKVVIQPKREPSELEKIITQLILGLIANHPLPTLLMTIMGFMRLWMKPLLAGIRKIASLTATKKDDLLLEKVERSAITKGIFWVLDWLFSAKLLPEKK